MKYEWTGDLDDDCTLTVGPYMGRAEALGTLVLQDEEFDDEDGTQQDYWFCAVYRDREQLFHSGEHGGFIFGGDMARGICEAIISACTAEAAKAEGDDQAAVDSTSCPVCGDAMVTYLKGLPFCIRCTEKKLGVEQ